MDNSIIWKIVDKYFHDNPQALVQHHIESYNDFYKNGIQQIFKQNNPIIIKSNYDEEIGEHKCVCNIFLGGKEGNKLYYGKPVIYDENNSHYMFPNEARLRNMSYSMTIHYDVDIEFIDILKEGEKPFTVGIEKIEQEGGSEDSPESYKVEKVFKKEMLEQLPPEFLEKELKPEEIEKIGGARVARKKREKIDYQLTTAQEKMLKEATENSLTSEKKHVRQIREYKIDRVYLGKFPIMVQSDYCVLSGLNPDARYNLGECKNDVGGYFIIDGKEKAVIPQEKFGDNMLYIRKVDDEFSLYSADIRSVSENVSKPNRNLSVMLVKPNSKYSNMNIMVNIPNVKKPIPLFIVFRALGVITDKDIITTCLLDLEKYENMLDLFIPSVHNAGGIMTQQLALKYIATLCKYKTTTYALNILSDYFLPHIGETNFIEKALYLGYMVFRLLSVYTGLEQPTDRDNFKYKRVELVGTLLNELFSEYYAIQLRKIEKTFEEQLFYNQGLYATDLFSLITKNQKDAFNNRIVDDGFKKAFKGNWGAQTHTKRIGVVQDLNRLSFNSYINHLRKTNLPLDSSVKLVGPRVLHGSQWGYFDPVDTPDGGNIGLHKHLAISTYITKGVSREPLIKWLREKISMKTLEECTPKMLSNMTKVIVNGYWCGVITEPIESVKKIKLYRRNALLPIYFSVSFDIRLNTVFMYTDSGRLCRPVFYNDENTGKMSYDNAKIIELIKNDNFVWKDLLTGFNQKKIDNFNYKDLNIFELNELYEGINAETNPLKLDRFLNEKAIIDYIDSSETETSLIAFNHEQISKNTDKKYTHVEIHESFILGSLGNLIIFPESNADVRNSFSCGQSKQACSLYHTNFPARMDKSAIVLNYGQIPIVKSKYLNYINKEENPYGENTIVAIMCYTGYNMEDSILINEASIKRGLFRTTYYTTYEAHEESSKNAHTLTDIRFENIEADENILGTKPGYDYSKLDKYGIIKEGTVIDDKTVLVGITQNNMYDPSKKIDMSKTPKKGQLGVVDKTFITEGEEGYRIAKVRICEQRIPAIGDKMASRAGQKGTIGLIVPEADMPFTKNGIRPDLIINPHALPSRRTIGQLIECIVGKASALYGGFSDCTPFNSNSSKVFLYGDMLTGANYDKFDTNDLFETNGFHSTGNEILYNGMTGEQLESKIFIGPNYYMRLKHMVKDKINYRSTGPRTALTRQPVSGRANDGGLRIGEMERDTVISHGAASFMRDSMMERGDKYEMSICNQTGTIAIVNPSKNIFLSPMADGPIKFTQSLDGKEQFIENNSKYGKDFSVVNVPYSLKLLMQELQTMNVQCRIITDDNIKYMENLSYSKNIDKLVYNKVQPEDKDVPKEVIELTTQILNDSNRNIARGIVSEAEYSVRAIENIETQPQFGQESPMYAPESPQYAPGSPMFSPTSPPYAPESPIFSPLSPYYNVETSPYSQNLEQNIESPPYAPESPPFEFEKIGGSAIYPDEVINETVSELNNDSYGNLKSTHSFQKNDTVYLKGDGQRIWKIHDIGDMFITIITADNSGLDSNLKVVTTADIIHPNQIVQSNKQMIYGGGMNYSNTASNIPSAHAYVGGGHNESMPNINIQPVFKIVGGNDNSIGDTPNTKTNSNIPMNNVSTNIDTSTTSELKTGGNETKSTIDESNINKIDFSKMVINKVQ